MSNKPTILYVDDEPINLELFEINFEDNYKVLTAQSGFQGLEMLDKNQDVLVVFSDMKMPQMDGLEFIKKAREKHPHIVYFILTGYDISVEIADALKRKVIQKYLCKPFDISAIEEILEETTNGLTGS